MTPIRRNDDGDPVAGSNASRIVGQSFTATSSLTSLSSFVFRTDSANDFTSGGPTLSVLVSDITGGGHSIVSNDTFDLSGLNIAAGDYFNISYSDAPLSLTAGNLYRTSLWFATEDAGLGNTFGIQRSQTTGSGPYNDGRFFDSGNLGMTDNNTFLLGAQPTLDGITRDLAFGVVAVPEPRVFTLSIAGFVILLIARSGRLRSSICRKS